MYIYIFIYVHIYIYMYTYTCIYIYIYIPACRTYTSTFLLHIVACSACQLMKTYIETHVIPDAENPTISHILLYPPNLESPYKVNFWWTPQPEIVTIRDTKAYLRVLFYSYYITTTVGPAKVEMT